MYAGYSVKLKKQLTSKIPNLLSALLREALPRVQPRADGGAAQRQVVQARQRRAHALHRVRELRRVAAELLAEGERHRVHQVRPRVEYSGDFIKFIIIWKKEYKNPF